MAARISHEYWTNKEVVWLTELAGHVKAKLIARKLDRSEQSVRQMAKRLRISLKIIKKHYHPKQRKLPRT